MFSRGACPRTRLEVLTHDLSIFLGPCIVMSAVLLFALAFAMFVALSRSSTWTLSLGICHTCNMLLYFVTSAAAQCEPRNSWACSTAARSLKSRSITSLWHLCFELCHYVTDNKVFWNLNQSPLQTRRCRSHSAVMMMITRQITSQL